MVRPPHVRLSASLVVGFVVGVLVALTSNVPIGALADTINLVAGIVTR